MRNAGYYGTKTSGTGTPPSIRPTSPSAGPGEAKDCARFARLNRPRSRSSGGDIEPTARIYTHFEPQVAKSDLPVSGSSRSILKRGTHALLLVASTDTG